MANENSAPFLQLAAHAEQPAPARRGGTLEDDRPDDDVGDTGPIFQLGEHHDLGPAERCRTNTMPATSTRRLYRSPPIASPS